MHIHICVYISIYIYIYILCVCIYIYIYTNICITVVIVCVDLFDLALLRDFSSSFSWMLRVDRFIVCDIVLLWTSLAILSSACEFSRLPELNLALWYPFPQRLRQAWFDAPYKEHLVIKGTVKCSIRLHDNRVAIRKGQMHRRRSKCSCAGYTKI